MDAIELNEMIFDGLRGVFAEHSVMKIDRFEIAPEQNLQELFGNDIERFGLAIAHFITDFHEQVGIRGYINVSKNELFNHFKVFNDIFVYFCLIYEA
jgi:hypothetical protein